MNLQRLELLDLYSNTFEEVPEIVQNMPSLKALDLEYNCFDVLGSLKNGNFLDKYIHMKCNMRSRLTKFSKARVDYQRPALDCDPCISDGMILLIVVSKYYEYSITPLIRINWDGEPSSYADNLDNRIFF